MRRITHRLAVAALTAASLTASLPTAALPRAGKRHADPPPADANALRHDEHAYGADPRQRLDVWPATASGPAPLILFVHAGELGVDASRIVLMGHSAGAHLVTLVGTDPRYLGAAGLSLSMVKGIIALDGAGYDVARQAAGAGPALRDIYAAAFGTDAARQQDLSPVFHAAAPNAPAFLIVHIDRADAATQSEALGAALRQAGTAVETSGVDGQGLRGHMEINRSLGSLDAPATRVVDTWLRRLLR